MGEKKKEVRGFIYVEIGIEWYRDVYGRLQSGWSLMYGKKKYIRKQVQRV